MGLRRIHRLGESEAPVLVEKGMVPGQEAKALKAADKGSGNG